jgi:hypothetical protein
MGSLSSRSSREWAKLDLLPHHIRHLMLAWIVPYSEEAVEEFGELLDDEGTFSTVLSYSKHRVKHHRIESARVGFDETADLSVTVHYEAGDALLSHIPKEAEEAAFLLGRLLALQVESPVGVKAVFAFPAGLFRSVVPLPLDIVPPAEHAEAFDEIVGIHAVKHAADDDDEGGHSFTLDRGTDGALELAVDFLIPAGPADQAPERALRDAVAISGLIVVKVR